MTAASFLTSHCGVFVMLTGGQPRIVKPNPSSSFKVFSQHSQAADTEVDQRAHEAVWGFPGTWVKESFAQHPASLDTVLCVQRVEGSFDDFWNAARGHMTRS